MKPHAAIKVGMDWAARPARGVPRQVRTVLTWCTCDPWVIEVEFREPLNRCVEVSRDAVAAGLAGDSGPGRVRFRLVTPMQMEMAIAPDDVATPATLWAPIGLVTAFVESTFVHIPAGTEAGNTNMDARLEEMLRAGHDPQEGNDNV